MKTSDFLNGLFFGCEYYNQVLLDQEKKSGRASGVTVIVDCTNMTNLSQYVNQSSAALRVGQLCLRFLAGWYGETWTEMIVYNPPLIGLVNMAIKMAALVVPKRILDKIVIVKTLDELLKRVPQVPLCGGDKKNQSSASNHNNSPNPNRSKNIFVTTGCVSTAAAAQQVGSKNKTGCHRQHQQQIGSSRLLITKSASISPLSVEQQQHLSRPQIWPTFALAIDPLLSEQQQRSSSDEMSTNLSNQMNSTSSKSHPCPQSKYLRKVGLLKSGYALCDSYKIQSLQAIKLENINTGSNPISNETGRIKLFWWFSWSGNGDLEIDLRYHEKPPPNETPNHSFTTTPTSALSKSGVLLYPNYTLACFKLLPEEGSVSVDSFEKAAPGIGTYSLTLRNVAKHATLNVTFAFDAFDMSSGHSVSIERSPIAIKLLKKQDAPSV